MSEEFAIFVSPAGRNSAGGTKDAPVRTLDRALALAHDAQKIVIACSTEGAFEQSLTIDDELDGSKLYGGFDCDTWEYSEDEQAEVVSPEPIALRVDQLDVGLTIEDFSFEAADATELSGSSIAALVTRSDNLRFRRVTLLAGEGAPGTEGAGATEAAGAGSPGTNGVAACTSGTQPNEGGAAVETVCEGSPSGSIGGRGGDGGTGANSAGNGNPGEPSLGGGNAGTGETGSAISCVENAGLGSVGRAGEPGISGSGGEGAGTLNQEGYSGAAGTAGENGRLGQGGGGGGGAKAPTVACTVALNPRTGASGGSGGSGGCGGKGGTGGGGGGASIALASVDSNVTLEDSDLVAKEGGDGGRGGSGQPGGDGGLAGKGAAGGGSASPSCGGGNGGLGGNGGRGGGGAGGASIGIAFVGTEPVHPNVAIDVASVSALGGADGAGMTTGDGAGSPGVIDEVRGF